MLSAVKTLLFGGLTGKALGVARELLTAALFGTGPIAVAYRLAQAAFLIPLHGFLSDAFSSGFTPAYARQRTADAARSRVLFASMHAAVLLVCSAVGLSLALLASGWVRALAPGFDAATARMAQHMVVVLALAMPFYGLTGLYAAAELAAGQARMAAARASAQNVGLISGALLAWWTGEPMYIAGGFLGAYVLLATWGLRNALVQGLRPWPHRGDWAEAARSLDAVWRAIRVLLVIPVLLQIHSIVERRVASVVSEQAVAALDYARFLSDTAVLLLAMPLGVAALGTMAAMSETRFRDVAHRSMRALLYAGVPLSVAAALHGEAIIRLIFARGAFGVDAVTTTAAILQWLGVGLWAQLIGYAGARFLSARDRNVALIGIYLASVGCNVVLNLLLHPYIGTAALGVAAAANGLVLGFLVLQRLGLLARLRRDLVTLGVLAGAYACLWSFAPPAASAHAWLRPLAFAAFWCGAAVLVPRCRSVLRETWLSLRGA